jgi:hypothetical protein
MVVALALVTGGHSYRTFHEARRNCRYSIGSGVEEPKTSTICQVSCERQWNEQWMHIWNHKKRMWECSEFTSDRCENFAGGWDAGVVIPLKETHRGTRYSAGHKLQFTVSVNKTVEGKINGMFTMTLAGTGNSGTTGEIRYNSPNTTFADKVLGTQFVSDNANHEVVQVLVGPRSGVNGNFHWDVTLYVSSWEKDPNTDPTWSTSPSISFDSSKIVDDDDNPAAEVLVSEVAVSHSINEHAVAYEQTHHLYDDEAKAIAISACTNGCMNKGEQESACTTECNSFVNSDITDRVSFWNPHFVKEKTNLKLGSWGCNFYDITVDSNSQNGEEPLTTSLLLQAEDPVYINSNFKSPSKVKDVKIGDTVHVPSDSRLRYAVTMVMEITTEGAKRDWSFKCAGGSYTVSKSSPRLSFSAAITACYEDTHKLLFVDGSPVITINEGDEGNTFTGKINAFIPAGTYGSLFVELNTNDAGESVGEITTHSIDANFHKSVVNAEPAIAKQVPASFNVAIDWNPEAEPVKSCWTDGLDASIGKIALEKMNDAVGSLGFTSSACSYGCALEMKEERNVCDSRL